MILLIESIGAGDTVSFVTGYKKVPVFGWFSLTKIMF